MRSPGKMRTEEVLDLLYEVGDVVTTIQNDFFKKATSTLNSRSAIPTIVNEEAAHRGSTYRRREPPTAPRSMLQNGSRGHNSSSPLARKSCYN